MSNTVAQIPNSDHPGLTAFTDDVFARHPTTLLLQHILELEKFTLREHPKDQALFRYAKSRDQRRKTLANDMSSIRDYAEEVWNSEFTRRCLENKNCADRGLIVNMGNVVRIGFYATIEIAKVYNQWRALGMEDELWPRLQDILGRCTAALLHLRHGPKMLINIRLRVAFAIRRIQPDTQQSFFESEDKQLFEALSHDHKQSGRTFNSAPLAGLKEQIEKVQMVLDQGYPGFESLWNTHRFTKFLCRQHDSKVIIAEVVPDTFPPDIIYNIQDAIWSDLGPLDESRYKPYMCFQADSSDPCYCPWCQDIGCPCQDGYPDDCNCSECQRDLEVCHYPKNWWKSEEDNGNGSDDESMSEDDNRDEESMSKGDDSDDEGMSEYTNLKDLLDDRVNLYCSCSACEAEYTKYESKWEAKEKAKVEAKRNVKSEARLEAKGELEIETTSERPRKRQKVQ